MDILAIRVQRWARERLVKSPGGRLALAAAHADYKGWASAVFAELPEELQRPADWPLGSLITFRAALDTWSDSAGVRASYRDRGGVQWRGLSFHQ